MTFSVIFYENVGSFINRLGGRPPAKPLASWALFPSQDIVYHISLRRSNEKSFDNKKSMILEQGADHSYGVRGMSLGKFLFFSHFSY